MLVLALDASLGPVSAALVDTAGTLVAVRRDDGGDSGRAERLPRLVADLLEAANVRPEAVDRVAVTTGPGGFTGVRVGVAFARGFALVRGIPAVGIDTLTALALSAEGEAAGRPVLAAVHGRNGHLVVQALAPGAVATAPPATIAAADLPAAIPAGAVLAGPAAALFATPEHPLAADAVSVEALAGFSADLDPGAHPPEPRYAAPPDAVRPAPSGLLAPAKAVPGRPEMPPRPAPAAAAGAEQ